MLSIVSCTVFIVNMAFLLPNCLIVDVLYLGECDYFDFNMFYKDQNV